MKRKFTFLIAAALMLLTMMAQPGRAWGQTTVTQTSFSAISGNVNNDSNVSYAAYKGEGTSNPAVNSNAIRLYQTSADKTGGYVVIGVADGYQITSATIRSTMATTTGYLLTDNDPGSTTPAKSIFDVSNYSLSANTDYTVDDIATRYITFACFGTSSSSRLYLSKISITYESTSGGNTPSLSVNPASLNFGNKAMNPDEPYYETFTVTYAYLTENLTINVGSGLTGVSVSPQEISKDGDGSQIVTVYYNPTTEGEISGNITVSNTEDELSKTVAVSGSSYDPANVDTYELYTGEIVEGDYVIYNTFGALLNELNNGPRFKNQEVNISDNVITNPSDNVVWHIAPSGDYWTIYNDNVNKYAGGTSAKNQGALLDEITDHAKWTMYYQYGSLVIENYGRSQDNSDPSNRYLRQNSTSGWATYASGTGLAPKLYKKVGATTYKVTYNANGAASGSVPTDSNEYESGAEVTVLGNTGNLAKSGYVWAGWNTKADGTGTDHAEGSKFNISENTTLYAKWDAKTITNLTYSGTPTATQYAGQAFNPAGLTVTATFNDESEEDVTSQVVWTPNPLTIETTSVAGTYMGLSVVVEDITVTYAPGTQDNPYTVAQARAATPATGTSANVYIHGIVSAFYNTSIVGDGSNYRYYISDDGSTTNQLLVYRGKGLNNETFSNANDLLIGDIVTIYGGLTMYQSEPEIASGNYLTSLERPAVDVEAPTYSIPEGGYAEAQTVTITCATDGATIYYTLDGSTPNNTSTTYSTPIAVSATTTIKAIAYVGESSSTVSSATYYIKSTGNTYTVTAALGFDEYPVNNIFVQGIVSTAPTSLLDGGLLTYYVSVDGEATNQLQVYKGKNLGNTAFTEVNDIQVGDIVTIFGNVKIYNNQKEFDQGNYLVEFERLDKVATPTFDPAGGEYTEVQTVTINCTTEEATKYYKFAENAEWTEYTTALNIAETTTIWAYAAKDGMNNSDVATATYTINIPVPSITVTPGEVDIVDAGGGGTLTATYTNMGDVDDILADIVFYESDGTTPATYDWITVNINNNDNTVVEYLAEENEGAARTAYFKVYGTTDGDNFTYSNLVTISQAAHVTPPTTDNYELYNGALVEGDYLIVYDGVAMNNVTLNDRLQYGDVEITEDVISTSNATIVWHIAPSGDYWTIYSADANAYAASTGAKSKAQMLADGTDDKALWTVSGTSTYEFVNKQNTANNVNANLRRNGTYGFACYATSTGGALSLYKKASTEPAITLDSYSIEANAEGLEGNLTVTYTNYENPDDIETVVWFCDENGENAVEYDWIVAEIDDKDVTNLYYIIDANNGAARTAYFKVHETSEDIYSELVTITQEAYVATITVVPAEVTDVPAAGDVPEHTVTLANLTISSADDFEFVYCDSEGNILGNEDPKPNWIELADAEYDLDSENVYTMMYTIAENTETTPRTGYFKIGVTQTSETVYSNLVTVTQEAAAAPTFTVSFTLDGGTFVPNEDFTDEIVEIEAGTYTLPSATKSGFTFVGWNDGATTYASGAEYTVSGNVTFTAQWTVITTATINFNNTATGTAINEASVSGNDSMGNTWTITTEGTTYFYAGYSYCQVGSSSNPATSITFTTTLAQTTTITAIEAKFGGFSGTAGTITMKVGDETVGTGSLDATNDVTVTNTKTESGTVLTITVTNIQKGIKCYYISYTISNAPIINATVDPLAYNATSGSIIYEIDNYVAGEMAATTEADWISDFTYEPEDEIGEVGFTTTPNELYESRSATVTLTYTYDDSKATVTKDVTVTQAAAPIPTYIVSFIVGEGGTFVPNDDFDDEMVEVEAGTYTLPSATKEGYTFDGWNDGEQTYAAGASYEVSDDVEFTATYTALPTYTVSFWVNGDIDNDLTETGSSIDLPTTSARTPDGFAIYGWALQNSIEAVANPYVPTADVTLYALLQLENTPTVLEKYVKVTEELTDWSGEYLIAYSDDTFADGRIGGTGENGIGALNVSVDLSSHISNNTISRSIGDSYKVTLEEISEGSKTYVLKTQDGKYNYQTSNNNGLLATENKETAASYPISVTFTSENDIKLCLGGNATGAVFSYNTSGYFRYYKNGGQNAVYLYKKVSETVTPTIVNVEYVYGTTSMPDNIPESTCYVVESGAVLTFTGTNEGTAANLVVQEGGQLIHTTDVEATVQKGVSGYINKSGDGWYLISSPVDNLPTSSVATGTYDLFAYDEATAYWWVDHAITGQTANHTFTTLERGKGYLYANTTDVNLNYAGTMKATNANIKVDLSYACDEYPYLKGFNLVGNPFTRNITAADMVICDTAVTSYYDFNADRTEFVTYRTDERPIQPGQGFFIQATGNAQQLEFNPASSKDASDFKYISISAGDENFTDKAYIQFGYGNTLRKMTFGENTMVYVMNDDDDYAAARVEELAGTIPVHFVPIEDGFYTITVETKNIENLNYMHLIDNIKNTEIDLLVEPSYTFKASESDNADRFHLVFDFNNYTGVNENYTNDNFAHQIGDEIFVSGEGTLQVFDVLGRFVTGYNVNGDKRISTAEFNTGVYIFRMVGTEVKTQKIIVR